MAAFNPDMLLQHSPSDKDGRMVLKHRCTAAAHVVLEHGKLLGSMQHMHTLRFSAWRQIIWVLAVWPDPHAASYSQVHMASQVLLCLCCLFDQVVSCVLLHFMRGTPRVNLPVGGICVSEDSRNARVCVCVPPPRAL